MLTPTDFILGSGGRLVPAWYAPHDLTALLTGWLTQYTSDTDDLTRARVYRVAFSTAADLFMAEPASQRDRDKSSAYASEQLAYWRRAAQEYQDEIDTLSGITNGPVITGWEGETRCRN